MRPLSQSIKKFINDNDYYRQCCICGAYNVEQNHTWIYQGRQINEWWAIMPLCVGHHRDYLKSFHKDSIMRDYIMYLSLKRLYPTNDFIKACQKYNRFDWHSAYKLLGKQFENFDIMEYIYNGI